MSDAIRFLRDRIEKSLPLYQGDIDSALAQAIQEDRAERAIQDGLDPERRLFALAQNGHTIFIRRHSAIPPGGTMTDITDGITVHIQGAGIARQSNARTTLSEALDDIDRAILRAAPPSKPVIGEVGEK